MTLQDGESLFRLAGFDAERQVEKRAREAIEKEGLEGVEPEAGSDVMHDGVDGDVEEPGDDHPEDALGLLGEARHVLLNKRFNRV